MTEQEKKIKEKVLESLLSYLDDAQSESLRPKKAMSVEVAAPDEEHLESGLDKAKELLSAKSDSMDESHESDEERMRELLADESSDEEEDKPAPRGSFKSLFRR